MLFGVKFYLYWLLEESKFASIVAGNLQFFWHQANDGGTFFEKENRIRLSPGAIWEVKQFWSGKEPSCSGKTSQ